ncbi:hypothetical protein [Trebonia sp.]|uniref:hypothetical protein n=2 Tax=Trebonia sp. TaxID=2767075 RepID=UPI003CC5A729
MPEPITTQLINDVWDTIKDAVTSGLDTAVPYAVPRPALDTVAIVSAEKIKATGGWQYLKHPDAPPHVRVETSGDAFDIMHHYELGYHDLHAPDTDAIKQWATAARQFELNVALRYYAEQADRVSYRTVGELYHADPDGWGQLRCVKFSPAIPEEWEKADLERTVKVDFMVEGIQALVYRIGGGPYVRRPADLSLSWTPLDHCKAELLLTEQLEFEKVGPKTIIGVRIDPSVSRAKEAPPSS